MSINSAWTFDRATDIFFGNWKFYYPLFKNEIIQRYKMTLRVFLRVFFQNLKSKNNLKHIDGNIILIYILSRNLILNYWTNQ